MPVSDEFIEYVLDQFASWGGVTSRKMFGGASLYREGKIFGLLADDVAYLKVDDSNRADYEAAGSSPFQPYPDKPNTMPYWEIPLAVLEDPGELIRWAEKSLAIPRK